MYRKLLVLALLLMVCAASVFADDLNPPPWRGDPGSTFAHWGFGTDDPSPDPDHWNNPVGPPGIQITPGTGMGWLSTYENRTGVWQLSGSIRVEVFNYPPENPYKWVWVQLTWAPQLPGAIPNVGVDSPNGPGKPSGISGGPIGGTVWNHNTYLFQIIPNPQIEWVNISGDINVDQLVIDTICIPEPSSLLALGGSILGLAGIAWRRRR